MHTTFNQPTLCCLVQAWTSGNEHVFNFRIDQALPKPGTGLERQRVLNQVEKHLNYLHGKTGLSYALVYWSDPVRFTAYINENSVELS